MKRTVVVQEQTLSRKEPWPLTFFPGAVLGMVPMPEWALDCQHYSANLHPGCRGLLSSTMTCQQAAHASNNLGDPRVPRRCILQLLIIKASPHNPPFSVKFMCVLHPPLAVLIDTYLRGSLFCSQSYLLTQS